MLPGARAVKVVTTAVLGLGPCLAECYIISTVIIINIANCDHVVHTPSAECMAAWVMSDLFTIGVEF